MRLKEIKPGMVIRCKNDEEKQALMEEAGLQSEGGIDNEQRFRRSKRGIVRVLS